MEKEKGYFDTSVFPDFGKLRATEKNLEPYFCLDDVCRILELKQNQHIKSRLKKDEVIVKKISDEAGEEQEITFISESNFYRLIFQSGCESAEKFKDWVTKIVLVAIRKYGLYAVDELLQLISDGDTDDDDDDDDDK